MNLEEIKSNYAQDARKWLENSTFSPDVKKQMASALEDFETWGLPHKKLEDWRYTSIKNYISSNLNLDPKTPYVDEDILPDIVFNNQACLVFINGRYEEKVSNLPTGFVLTINRPKLDLTPEKGDAFEALNLATSQGIVTITVGQEANLKDTPLTIAHVSTQTAAGHMMTPRLEIIAERNSESCFFEVFINRGDDSAHYERNAVTRLSLADGAHVEHVKAVLESNGALHIGKVRAELDRNAKLNSFTFSAKGGLVRNNIDVDLNGEGSEVHADGLFALRGNQHHDNFSTIRHNKPHTSAHQLFKGILDEKSHGVFTGKILVAKDSQQVDSSQLNKNLLLSKKAHVDTRPQLEVYADDVKCAHGATVGQLSLDEVFYLESRGIPRDRAQKILCHAFAVEAIEKVQNEHVRNGLSTLLFENFEKFTLDNLGNGDKK